MQFTVDVFRDGAAVVVAPRGELDLATVNQLRNELARHASAPVLVLDLRGLTFMDSSGVALVLEQQRSAEAAGSDFRLVPGPRAVQRLFEMTKLARHLHWTTVESAGAGETGAEAQSHTPAVAPSPPDTRTWG
ncbi:MAG TPA: STAS domain-containing protein [Solirubrobacteraceae bacterium]|nr:STAS domain-containing protein [Solirubrobacteraceae bacterium]